TRSGAADRPAARAARRARRGAAHATVRHDVAGQVERVVQRKGDIVSLTVRAVGRTRRGCRDRQDAAGAARTLLVGRVRDRQRRAEEAAVARAVEELARAAGAVAVVVARVVVVGTAGADVAARLGGPSAGEG